MALTEAALSRARWRKSSYSGANGECVEVAHVPGWHKSSHSGGNGECVEVAQVPGWHKSSYSGANHECVEVADFGPVVAVRDSKDPDGPKLAFAPAGWRAFISGVKAGGFDQ